MRTNTTPGGAHALSTAAELLPTPLALRHLQHGADQREPLKLLRVTPAGEDVPSVQIVFEFNRPVVPLGRMERLPEEVPLRSCHA